MQIPKDWRVKRRVWSAEHEAQLDALFASLDDRKVHQLLVSRRWRWASSEPYQTPIMAHSYTIREWQDDDIEFEALLRWIGSPLHSVTRRFGSRKYVEYTDPFEWPQVQSRFFGQVSRWFLWSMKPVSMAAEIHSQYASVLNRKPLKAMELRPEGRQGELQPRLF